MSHALILAKSAPPQTPSLSWTQKTVKAVRMQRYRARTDLMWFCHDILGWPDVCEAVHGPLIRHLQAFPRPTDAEMEDLDQFHGFDKETGQPIWVYTPFVPMLDLEGPRRRLILDFRSSLKCLRRTQTVTLESGLEKQAQKLEVGDRIWGTQDDGSLEPTVVTVTGIEEQEEQRIYRVTMRSGRVIEVSHNHPFRKVTGWIQADALSVGDRIAVLGGFPTTEDRYIPSAEIVGWFLGDGSMSNQTVSNSNEFFWGKIIDAAIRAGGTASLYRPPNGDRHVPFVRVRGLRKMFREYGLMEAKSATKFVPEEFFHANGRTVRELLYGLFMSDGTCGKNSLSMTTVSPRLAKDVQRLLLKIGIHSTVNGYRTRYKGSLVPFWSVIVYTHKYIKKFFDEVGWDKVHRFTFSTDIKRGLINTVPKEWRTLYPKYLWERGKKPKMKYGHRGLMTYDTPKSRLAEYGELLDDDFMKFLSTDKIVWDWVKSVEEIGREGTIGVETSSGTLCLEGVVTHNTTINTMGHTIQWIVNYPDISVLLIQANEERAFENINGILGHFRANPRFRSLFPEHVTWESPFAFGTQSSFTTKARRDWLMNKHETVITGSITKGAAGKHVHVIKFSDPVDEVNSAGDSGIRMVINKFGMYEPILISPHYWMDAEGTRYRHSDLYGEIMRSEAKKKEKTWSIYVRGWCKKIGPNGESQKFVQEELAWDDMLGPDGKPVPWWPQRVNWEYIQEKIADPAFGDYNVACQYRNNPSDLSDKSQKAFHMGDFKTITPELFYQNVRVAYYSTTVDTAESWGDMAKKTSDYSAITTCAWDASGRCYVVDVKHGRMSTDDLINKVFEVGRKYRPQWVRIEETGYVRGLKGGFQRLIQLDAVNNNINYPVLNFRFVPRDNQKSKKERILLTLQYPYKKGDIVFLANLASLDWIRAELEMFPGFHDDVLDTLADQWQDREWFGRLVVRNDQAQPQVGADPLNALNSRQKQAEALMASGAYRDFQFDRMVNGEVMGGGAPFPRHSFSDRIGGL